MVVNSITEIYTALFGWHLYGALWDIMVGTGLAFIPFIAVIGKNFYNSYRDSDTSAKDAIKSLEMDVVLMVVVLILAVMPARFWPMTINDVQYRHETLDCNAVIPNALPGNNTGSNLDAIFATQGATSVYMPVWWGVFTYVSTAVTNAGIASIDCTNNFNFMTFRLDSTKIQDPTLRQDTRDFYEICYKPALSKTQENRVQNLDAEDLSWLGSNFLLNTPGYYDSLFMQVESNIGWVRDPVTRESDAAYAAGVYPYCDEMWRNTAAFDGVSGLRERLLADLPADVSNDWLNWGYQVVTNGAVSQSDREDLMLRRVLEVEGSDLQEETNLTASSNLDTDYTIGDRFNDAVGFFALISEVFKSGGAAAVATVVGPIAIALVQMIIIFCMPIISVMTSYQMRTVFIASATYFALEFIHVIWAAGFWIDNIMVDAIKSNTGWTDAMGNLVLTSIGLITIFGAPLIWMGMITWAGVGLARSMTGGGIGSSAMGAGIASGAGSQMASHAGSQAMRRGGKAFSAKRGK